MPVKRVAVIGLGPGGAITIDALVKEKAFDVIRVFERREAPGGCWIEDQHAHPNLDPSTFDLLASRKADLALEIPESLPARTPKLSRPRYAESSVYPYLETNVDAIPMSFSQEPIPTERSQLSISRHGKETPFRHHSIVRNYIAGLVDRNGYENLVSYNTAVELAEKDGKEWRLVLRRESSSQEDEWWEERFDAVIVASGHYNVPYIPKIKGLADLEKARPGSVKHSKMFRGRDAYRGKKVVVVGASVSAADIAYDLAQVAQQPVYAVIEGHKANGYFGDVAFKHPAIATKPSISHVSTADGQRTVHFIDGTSVADVDHIIFGTGYSWSLSFLPKVEVRNNRVPGLYQHVVYQQDHTLLFVGAVGAGLTFKVFEWQGVLAARILSGRAKLPPLEEQQQWEKERIAKRGDGGLFLLIFPDFEEYFETLRKLAGEPKEGEPGRKLPAFDRSWEETFMRGHELRKKWWREENDKALLSPVESTNGWLPSAGQSSLLLKADVSHITSYINCGTCTGWLAGHVTLTTGNAAGPFSGCTTCAR
ncbi:FAD/NAD(P)-binding domain-containing protein [Paraphaeosphaeria sporulosa]|uniref:FAD/NAD(P)-binding domain-containing protein n=1 Tax=Paraphaeosphaeria sporulosa TaxID=1460663 RepID=A0A177CYL0_9PLEO|nr:FAD/NAD(P)-binding domain-containing protein [Paraphaeosphaeria sporulosa]OAG12346.1 FAD/NAD(P)-binding domain-containing protein [Paraphaeosphaeria sporulosa]